jgi:hypothetical protein
MTNKVQSPPDIYTRLKLRGVEYEHVHRIVQFDVPQIPFFFARQFGNRTLKKVLKHIESWKQFLKTEYLLMEELKVEVSRWVKKTEALVWDTIRDTNYQIDDWSLYWVSTPPREAADGKHIMSGWMVTATNQKTSEQRKHELMGCGRGILRAYGQDYPATYRALGLFDQLWLKAPGPFLISGRASQGWPVYARMIPRLYDLLAPHYQDERGHCSVKIDLEGTVNRPARYPKKLIEDMLEILRMHHPGVFEKTTINQLKAAIQRHLSRKPTQRTNTL